ASSALPFFFPAIKINREYFGDGSMRQIAPISSAMQLGADRIMVIGVNQTEPMAEIKREEMGKYPSMAQIAGHALNSIFIDSMEVDLERVQKINELVRIMPEEARRNTNLREVDVLVITPSESIDQIAERYINALPISIRLLLRLAGTTRKSGTTLLSYLLSEGKYCRALIDLGYRDAINRRAEIQKFLKIESEQKIDMPQ
ncbi:MAG: patatin-like phospholipase family protein, partial [Gammaproteobacteria bacterium]|nr:patatin-like phospholipase family protein [Gammaproteobacteria bacterium]